MDEAAALSPDKDREVRANFAAQGLMRAMGAEMAHLSAGRCVLAMPFSDQVGQQSGFFHGGAIGALGDAAGGYAALSLMDLGSDVLTLEYKVNFLRPASGRLLVAEGGILRHGRTVSVARIDVFVEADRERRMCAALQQSIMRVPPKPARTE